MDKKDSVKKDRASKLSRAGNESVTQSANVTIDNDGYTSGTPSKSAKFAIDPQLIMDDIIEKLQLLEYVQLFCYSRGHKPVSRTYFAVGQDKSEPNELKVKYFIELCYWLMSLGWVDSQR